MKKILSFLLLLVLNFSFQIANWENTDEIKQDKVKIIYKDYFTRDKNIKITWINTKTCEIISIANKKISIKKEENSIEFNTKDLTEKNFNKWTIKLKCNNKFKYIVYSIPWIKTIIKDDTYMIWFIPDNIKEKNLYIKNWNLISNEKILNFKIPKIKYIKSKNWFKYKWNIYLYFENFKKKNKSYILINNKRIEITKIEYKKNYLILNSELFKLSKKLRTSFSDFSFWDKSALKVLFFEDRNSAVTLKNTSGLKAFISRSLSTNNLTATDWTLPADNLDWTFRHKTEESSKPTSLSNIRRACWALTKL